MTDRAIIAIAVSAAFAIAVWASAWSEHARQDCEKAGGVYFERDFCLSPDAVILPDKGAE